MGCRGGPSVEEDDVKVKSKAHISIHSHIDPSVLVSLRKGVPHPKGAGDRPRDAIAEGDGEVLGYLVVYADDVLILVSGIVIDRITEALKAKWNITYKPANKWGCGDQI